MERPQSVPVEVYSQCRARDKGGIREGLGRDGAEGWGEGRVVEESLHAGWSPDGIPFGSTVILQLQFRLMSCATLWVAHVCMHVCVRHVYRSMQSAAVSPTVL